MYGTNRSTKPLPQTDSEQWIHPYWMIASAVGLLAIIIFIISYIWS
jgi:hypothetical protein